MSNDLSQLKEELKTLLPQDFPSNSSVWVYQSSRPFSEQQILEVKEQLHQFAVQWVVHGVPLRSWADLLFGRFIVFIADEQDMTVSGCSIDSTVRLLKSIERQYDTHLFDRLSITFLMDGKPQALPLNQVQYALDNGHITPQTLLFNNQVNNLEELYTHWLQPLSNSWLKDRITFSTP